MATVPKTERQVAAQAGPAVFQQEQRISAPAGAFGAGQGAALAELGQAAAGVGDVVGEILLAKQAEDNAREAKRLDLEYSAKVRELMYGTPNNPGGFYSSRGQNTLDTHGTTADALEQARQDIMKKTTDNPQLQARMDQLTAARRERELNQMAVFGETQRRTANDEVSEARIQDAASDAAAAVSAEDGPQRLTQSLVIAANEIQDMADRNGWSPEVQLHKMEEAQTVILRGVIENALVNDPALAQQIYDDRKGMISGAVHADIEKALESGTLRQQSQEAAAKFISDHPESLKDQVAAVKDSDLSPKVKDETVRRLKDQDVLDRQAKAQEQSLAEQEVWNQVRGGASLDDIDDVTKAKVGRVEFTQMQAFERRRLDTRNGFAEANDPDIIDELNNMSDPEFAALNLNQGRYLGALRAEKWSQFSDRQNKLQNGSDAEKSALRSATQVRNDKAKEYGLDKPEDAAKFRDQFDDLVELFEDQNGRPPDNSELKDIGDTLGKTFNTTRANRFFAAFNARTEREFRRMTPDQINNIDITNEIESNSPDDRVGISVMLGISEDLLDEVLAVHEGPETVGAIRNTIREIMRGE
jgi:hypothetical protein